VINQDLRAHPWLRVAFLPDYNVTAMEVICAGTDLSEQISTAGKEASGTGNMKFMMNGALTIGTLDGANIEIREAVGAENFFLFGLTAAEVADMRHHYSPDLIIENDPSLSDVMQRLQSGYFNENEPGIFEPLIHSIRNPADNWMTAADFGSYLRAQQSVSHLHQDKDLWTKKSILNTAASAFFSSDRTIRAYADDIWHIT
jgi:starch phosphorylase